MVVKNSLQSSFRSFAIMTRHATRYVQGVIATNLARKVATVETAGLSWCSARLMHTVLQTQNMLICYFREFRLTLYILVKLAPDEQKRNITA